MINFQGIKIISFKLRVFVIELYELEQVNIEFARTPA